MAICPLPLLIPLLLPRFLSLSILSIHMNSLQYTLPTISTELCLELLGELQGKFTKLKDELAVLTAQLKHFRPLPEPPDKNVRCRPCFKGANQVGLPLSKRPLKTHWFPNPFIDQARCQRVKPLVCNLPSRCKIFTQGPGLWKSSRVAELEQNISQHAFSLPSSPVHTPLSNQDTSIISSLNLLNKWGTVPKIDCTHDASFQKTFPMLIASSKALFPSRKAGLINPRLIPR